MAINPKNLSTITLNAYELEWVLSALFDARDKVAYLIIYKKAFKCDAFEANKSWDSRIKLESKS